MNPNPTLRLFLRTGAALVLAAALSFAAEPMRLRQALQDAIAKAGRDNSRESVAEAQLGLLRSMDRVQVDLRPQVGFFSFSQPSLLATSAGAGILVSRRTAPGESAIQSAEMDVLDSEIARKRARLRTEIETARQFFDLVGKQENARQTCASLEDAQRRQVEMTKLVKSAKFTAVDLVRLDEQVLERQLECVDAETQRKLGALQLATLTGASTESGELRVEDADLPVPGPERPLPSLDKLLDIALDFREEAKLVRDQIAAVKPKGDVASRVRPDVALGYYHVQENSNVFGKSTPNYLLGGNTVRAEATWNVPLRHGGEHAAARDLLDAKLRSLEAQLRGIRDEIRNELAASHVLASASLEKLPVSRRRMELYGRGRTLVATRFQSGLGSPSGLFEAEQEAVRAQSGLTQATCDLKASTFIMLAIAGIEDKPAAEQERLLGYSLPPRPAARAAATAVRR